MVFLHFDFCRGKTISAVHFVRELLKAPFPKPRRQFFFCHGVFNHNYRQTIQVFFPFSLFLFRFPAGDSFRFSSVIFCGNSFRFVEKYNLSIHFHERNLFIGLMPLR